MPGVALIAAGGTGGHLFPAESLALALAKRGWRIHLATDHRVEAYGHDFPAEKVHTIPSATITRSPLAAARALVRLGLGYLAARRLVRTLEPAVAIGFGGYPTVPPMLAAARAGVPTVIHDQNAVLGRANKFLAPRATAIAVSFARVDGSGKGNPKLVETGNPVRPQVLEAAKVAYGARRPRDPFNLLVFGGSQGARFFSELVPVAVSLLPADVRSRLRIVQQARPEDLEKVEQAYAVMGIKADLQPFFRDLPLRIANSHLVVCRSGASTIAELAVIGRPAIMVPLPGAIDQDQKANAEVMAGAGGGWMVEQRDMNPERLAGELRASIDEPGPLAAAAESARRVGRPDAVERLADLVERIAAEGAAGKVGA